jgi:hypothetical protein
MSEGFPLPEKRDVSAEQKLEVLMQLLEDLSGPDYEGIDPKLVEEAKKRTEARIEELRKEHPELNN